PFQNGDTIIITTITILFVDVTIIEWNLSSGSGSKTEVGFALGGGVDNVRYEIQNVRRVTP
ncbi:MAG: hypothetical protein KDK27_17975, partial [Leptospiraceae bacterium]|nr:hypothetical protein [Leptospiraceae bacterium]